MGWFYMSGNKEWERQQELRRQRTRGGQQQQGSSGGGGPSGGGGYSNQPSQTYFPNANAGAPTQQYSGTNGKSYYPPGGDASPASRALIQQHIAAMKHLGPDQLQTYTLPSGGTVTVPQGSRLPSGYTANAATPAEANLIQQQGRAQGYYGNEPSQFPAPTPTQPNQYAGGPYTQQGGVVNPAPTFPNVFQRFGSAVGGLSSLYNLPATQSLVAGAGNYLGNLYNNLFGSRTTAQQPGGYPSYAYRPPLVLRNQPRSYFDDFGY